VQYSAVARGLLASGFSVLKESEMIDRKIIPVAGALALAAFVGIYAPSAMAGTVEAPADSFYAPGTAPQPAGPQSAAVQSGGADANQTAQVSGFSPRSTSRSHGIIERQDQFLYPSLSSPGASPDPAPGPGNN
jgi:hypothetical protein